jgi:hypothetical protein
MTPTKQLLREKKAVTPLWIVALFVSLTELVLGAAVTQTTGGIQIGLTVFVIAFPTLVAASFFVTLWYKPYVFYPPTEFGHQTNVAEYVEAMQRKPTLLKQAASVLDEALPTEKEAQVAEKIVDTFLVRLPTNGLIFLYAYSLAYSKKVPLDIKSLCAKVGPADDGYAWAVLTTTSATGLIAFTVVKGSNPDIVNVTEMNQKLRLELGPALAKRMDTFDEKKFEGITRESYIAYIRDSMAKIERYF